MIVEQIYFLISANSLFYVGLYNSNENLQREEIHESTVRTCSNTIYNKTGLSMLLIITLIINIAVFVNDSN